MLRNLSLALVLLASAITIGCAGGTGVANNSAPANNQGGTGGTLTAAPASVDFGSVSVGTAQTAAVTLSNTSTQDVHISQLTVAGKDFTLTSQLILPFTVAAGQNAMIGLQYQPSVSGPQTASLNIVSDASLPTLSVPLSGNGVALGQIVAVPSPLAFGNVATGSVATLSVAIENPAGAQSVTISEVAISGDGFALASPPSLPTTLAGGQNLTLSATFTPSATGNSTGTIAVTSTAINSNLAIPLTGAGVAPGQLSATPTAVDFGSVGIGSIGTASLQLNNIGGQDVNVSQLNLTGSGFAIASAPTLPFVVAAGQSAIIGVSFTPQAAGAASGSLSVVSDASNSPLALPLTGVGLPPGQISSMPAALNFGSVSDGSISTLTVALDNSTGGQSVIVTQLNITGSGFSLSSPPSLPLTIPAGQAANVQVSFDPATGGQASGNLAVISNAIDPNLSIGLSGMGLAPGQLGASPTSLNLGSVDVGSSANGTVQITNAAGGQSVIVSSLNVTGAEFSLGTAPAVPFTLTPGQSVNIGVSFNPTTGGSALGSLVVDSNASNPVLTVGLSGVGLAPGQLGANPTSLNFGNVDLGTNSNSSVQITNGSGGQSVIVSAVNVTGSGFSLTSSVGVPFTLAPGQSKMIGVTFAPTSGGQASGSLGITSNATDPNLEVPLSGDGIDGQLSVSPTTLAFGTQYIGSQTTKTGTLTASNASVTVTSANWNGTGYSVSGISFPVTIPAGNNATFQVTFAPTTSGASNGGISFVSNASNSPTAQVWTGTGKQAQVLLSWNASLTQGALYNVYRGTQPGQYPTKLTSSPQSQLTFVDTNVQTGATYYYVTTAVAGGQESSYSNQASAGPIP